jgi:hypothetical protein
MNLIFKAKKITRIFFIFVQYIINIIYITLYIIFKICPLIIRNFSGVIRRKKHLKHNGNPHHAQLMNGTPLQLHLRFVKVRF